MVTYTYNIKGIDRTPLAEEIIGSAARLLTVAGFGVDEISALFRQAADQIDTGEATSQNEREFSVDEDEDQASIDRYDLTDKFDALPVIKSLNRLAKRANVIESIDDEATLSKAMDIVLEAVKFRLEGLSWLVANADAAGLEVESCKEDWIANATDDELDDEDRIVFLDDYQYYSQFNWYIVSQIVRYLSQSGAGDVLSPFADLLLNESLALGSRIKDEIKQAVATAEMYDDFHAYVRSHAGQGELAQSDFLDNFVRIYSFEGGTYLLQSWLDVMARAGEVDRSKRSNRWRVTVF